MAASAPGGTLSPGQENLAASLHTMHTYIRKSSGLCSTLHLAYIQQVSHFRMKYHMPTS